MPDNPRAGAPWLFRALQYQSDKMLLLCSQDFLSVFRQTHLTSPLGSLRLAIRRLTLCIYTCALSRQLCRVYIYIRGESVICTCELLIIYPCLIGHSCTRFCLPAEVSRNYVSFRYLLHDWTAGAFSRVDDATHITWRMARERDICLAASCYCIPEPCNQSRAEERERER